MQWTVANVVRSHAAARPGAPMITFGERTVTYGEMAARAARIAQALRAAGVRPQDRVAFLDKNGLEYFEVLFGGGIGPGARGHHRVRPAPAGPLQVPDVGGLRGRAAAQPVGQAAEAPAPRAVLGRPLPEDCLATGARRGRRGGRP